MDPVRISYRIKLSDERTFHHEVELNAETLTAVHPQREPPEWTALSNHTCPNCPLKAETSPTCPAALATCDLVRDVSAIPSTAAVEVTVTTPERTVSTQTSAQRAVGSLLGLIMATSGCPRTAFLKPMARYHLPFSSGPETMYRVVSMWALKQLLQRRKGTSSDDTLADLLEHYSQLAVVNRHMAQRLREAAEKDAAVNAVVLLDVMARNVPFNVDDDLVDFEQLFAAAEA